MICVALSLEILDNIDERLYDSCQYPKNGNDDEESDCPQHCGSHSDCINNIYLEHDVVIGCLIGNSLTGDGIEYVKGVVRDGNGPVCDFWRNEFDYIDFDD